jgi:hypothetical protein
LGEAASDILKLTMLNCNMAAFCYPGPITIAFARRVRDILKLAKGKDSALHLSVHM